MSFSIKKGFTLVEMIIVVVILTVAIVSAIVFLNNWINFTKVSRQKVIAINFARQWIESVYQIRDTNWQKWAGKKDQCWLKKDPLVDVDDDWCENDEWMWTGYYVIIEKTLEWNKYLSLSWMWVEWFDINSGMSSNNVNYRLCYQTWKWLSCPWTDRSIWNSSEWIFLSEIQWKWLYTKNTSTIWWDLINCLNWDTPDCGNWQAMEYRFCSKVWYIWWVKWEIEICSLITNFME